MGDLPRSDEQEAMVRLLQRLDKTSKLPTAQPGPPSPSRLPVPGQGVSVRSPSPRATTVDSSFVPTVRQFQGFLGDCYPLVRVAETSLTLCGLQLGVKSLRMIEPCLAQVVAFGAANPSLWKDAAERAYFEDYLSFGRNPVNDLPENAKYMIEEEGELEVLEGVTHARNCADGLNRVEMNGRSDLIGSLAEGVLLEDGAAFLERLRGICAASDISCGLRLSRADLQFVLGITTLTQYLHDIVTAMPASTQLRDLFISLFDALHVALNALPWATSPDPFAVVGTIAQNNVRSSLGWVDEAAKSGAWVRSLQGYVKYDTWTYKRVPSMNVGSAVFAMAPLAEHLGGAAVSPAPAPSVEDSGHSLVDDLSSGLTSGASTPMSVNASVAADAIGRRLMKSGTSSSDGELRAISSPEHAEQANSSSDIVSIPEESLDEGTAAASAVDNEEVEVVAQTEDSAVDGAASIAAGDDAISETDVPALDDSAGGVQFIEEAAVLAALGMPYSDTDSDEVEQQPSENDALPAEVASAMTAVPIVILDAAALEAGPEESVSVDVAAGGQSGEEQPAAQGESVFIRALRAVGEVFASVAAAVETGLKMVRRLFRW